MFFCLAADEEDDILYMRCVGEHVDGLYGHDLVVGIEILEIACLGGGVAADVDDAAGSGTEDGLHHVGVHACPWRVGDDDVGTTMTGDEVVGEDVFHVAGVEEGVVDVVQTGVLLGIFDGLGNILDADDLTGLTGHEVGNGARASVEVVDERK